MVKTNQFWYLNQKISIVTTKQVRKVLKIHGAIEHHLALCVAHMIAHDHAHDSGLRNGLVQRQNMLFLNCNHCMNYFGVIMGVIEVEIEFYYLCMYIQFMIPYATYDQLENTTK